MLSRNKRNLFHTDDVVINVSTQAGEYRKKNEWTTDSHLSYYTYSVPVWWVREVRKRNASCKVEQQEERKKQGNERKKREKERERKNKETMA